MANIVRIGAVVLMMYAGVTIGNAAIQSMQSAANARAAAMCEVDARYCR
jgi:hypothetical protein